MNFRRNALIATVAVAAATASACSPVQEKPSPSLTPQGATGPLRSAVPTPPTPTLKYISIPEPALPRDSLGGQFGSQPYTGILLGQHQYNGKTDDCTAGPAVRSGSRVGFVVAGHCDKSPGEQVYIFNQNAKPLSPVGVYAQAVDNNIDTDSAVIWPNLPPRDAGRIAGMPVAGVMPESQVRALPAGTPVCLDGAKAGVKCTELTGTGDMIGYRHITGGGDSGSAVFVVDQRHRITLIGIHSGVKGATYLEPALNRLGVSAVTAN